MAPRFTLAPMDCSTRFGPLVALGFFVRQHDLWAPFWDRVCFNTPTHCKEPLNALYDMWIGILADRPSRQSTGRRKHQGLFQWWAQHLRPPTGAHRRDRLSGGCCLAALPRLPDLSLIHI